jgi:TRAP-type C4-dicarboxylate transport system substrate-binding protein
MSEKTYNKMTEKQREVFAAALHTYIEAVKAAGVQDAAKFKKLCQDAGCEFIDIDISEFQNAVKPMYKDFPQYEGYLKKISAID